MRGTGERRRPREDRRPGARGTGGPTGKTPEPLARVLLSCREAWEHGGFATPCLCADPCTHNGLDPNRLTYCFRNFWSHGIWQFHVLVVHEDHVLSVI